MNKAGSGRTFKMRTIIAAVITIIALVSMGAFVLADSKTQSVRSQEMLAEEARVFADEMDAVWEFMETARTSVDEAEVDYYIQNKLFCSTVGRSVGIIFSDGNDYKIRYTNFNPRNLLDLPDEYESKALTQFNENSQIREYYGLGTFEGSEAFRYVRAIAVEESCLDCHGEPVGQLDATGNAKEGWTLDSIGGAISIVIPVEAYKSTVFHNVAFDAVLALVALILVGGCIYFVLAKFVFRPLDSMKVSFARLKTGSYTPEEQENFQVEEVHELTESFNEMAQTLQTLYADLETRVADRVEELSKANEQLEYLNSRLEEEVQHKTHFLSMVSHELRTPLTSIMVFTQLLKEKAKKVGDSTQHKAWTEIEKNCYALLEMINNMLDMARFDAGSVELLADYIDLGDVLVSLRTLADPLAERANVQLSATIDAGVPLVYGDYEKTLRMLENLVNNAIKFTPEGGSVRVEVTLGESGEWVQIRVTDTGIGIAPEDKERVFERFVQVGSSSERRRGGTGLGLSIVKEYATLQGYQLDVESRQGAGSVFTVCIPVRGEGEPEGETAAVNRDEAEVEGRFESEAAGAGRAAVEIQGTGFEEDHEHDNAD